MTIPEARWDSNKTVSVRGIEGLHAYRQVRGIEFSYADFYLNGQLLSVGAGGINAGEGISNIWGQGVTTAIGNTLIFHPKSGADNALRIEGQIDNNEKGAVGILVKNLNSYSGPGIIRISGNYNNLFTGDVVVDGKSSHLYLGKYSGEVAVAGNSYVRNGGQLGIEYSHQFVTTSTVTLQGQGSTFSLNAVDWALSTKFKTLSIDGAGRVLFDRSYNQNYRKTLIIDELVIAEGSLLEVEGWNKDLDLFLVKRDAKNVDALRRIKFTGTNQNIVELVDYDRDYWRFHASPEPATYGLMMGAMGLGLVLWRKRYRGARDKTWSTRT